MQCSGKTKQHIPKEWDIDGRLINVMQMFVFVKWGTEVKSRDEIGIYCS
jgi:hypothetical protein